MNMKLKIENKPVGTFAYRMCRREHEELAALARFRNRTLSGLIRGLLRQWHDDIRKEGLAHGR